MLQIGELAKDRMSRTRPPEELLIAGFWGSCVSETDLVSPASVCFSTSDWSSDSLLLTS